MNSLIPSTLCLMLFTAVNPAFAGDKAAPAAKEQMPAYAAMVNGQPVLQISVDYMIQHHPAKVNVPDDLLKQRVRDELETQTLMAQELAKSGADKTPQIAAQLDLAKLAILSKAYVQSYFKEHPVTEEALKTEYERKKAAGELFEYHLRNILVKNEKDANEIAGKLRAGSDFAALAKARSADPGAETNGGDIGWVRPDIFIDQNFADAVKTLKKPGDYTPKPVATRFGWNLLKLEEKPRHVEKLPNYDDIPKDIKKVMREIKMQHMLDEAISQLKSRAKIAAD